MKPSAPTLVDDSFIQYYFLKKIRMTAQISTSKTSSNTDINEAFKATKGREAPPPTEQL